MNKKMLCPKQMVTTFLVCLLFLAFLIVAPAGHCGTTTGESEYMVTARAVIATHNTQKIRGLLNEWIEKFEESCDSENPTPSCREISEAIELLRESLK